MKTNDLYTRAVKLNEMVKLSDGFDRQITDELAEVIIDFYAEPLVNCKHDSVEIWKEIKEVLEKLDMMPCEILDQDMIDQFFLKLLDLGELKMFKQISAGQIIGAKIAEELIAKKHSNTE